MQIESVTKQQVQMALIVWWSSKVITLTAHPDTRCTRKVLGIHSARAYC